MNNGNEKMVVARVPEETIEDHQSKYEFNSTWSERVASLIIVGLAVEIAAVFVFKKPFWETVATILANVLIVAGVWGELIFAKRAKAASDKIVAAAHTRAAIAIEGAKRAFVATEPRTIDRDKFSETIRIGPPGKAEILYARQDGCMWLALNIHAALITAGWVSAYRPLDEASGDKAHLSAAMAAGGGVNGGITVLAKSPLNFVDLKNDPFAALHSALILAGISGSGLTCMEDKMLPEGLIRIIVAPRP